MGIESVTIFLCLRKQNKNNDLMSPNVGSKTEGRTLRKCPWSAIMAT